MTASQNIIIIPISINPKDNIEEALPQTIF